MVVEEFSRINREYEGKIDPRLVPHDTQLWGPSYFLDIKPGHDRTSYYVD
jgi:hypothetical protein